MGTSSTLRAAGRRALLLAASCVAAACGGPTLHVEVRPEVPARTSSVLRAGAAEADLTPPPGAPLFGYALLSAATAAKGYRTRLKARVIVLEGPVGGRLALVQIDLGAPSRLLHQLVANQVASLGFGPDRIVLAATHTHAGPGGYFENGFYNDFGAGWLGFDPVLTGFLASRIADAVASAVYSLAPAKVAEEMVRVPFVTENRSAAAFRENDCPGCGGEKLSPVDDRLRLLRVDRIVGSSTEPLGAFAVFAVHGTAVSESNQLYHGDVLGYAARRLSSLVHRAHPGVVSFVAAVANGAEGDVTPTKDKQGFLAAELSGRAIAEKAFAAYESAGDHLTSDADVAHAYREIVVPGAHTVAGDVCDVAMIGIPTIAGSEDGPSAFRGRFGVYEGRKKAVPDGCQGVKEPAFGSLTQYVVLGDRVQGPETMPRIGAFEVAAIASTSASATRSPEILAAFATVPGEPTTAVGAAIRDRVVTGLGDFTATAGDRVAVIGLADAYLGYFADTAEYGAQHYEGGSTFYGPLQSLLAAEQLGALAGRLREDLEERVVGTPPRERSAGHLLYRESDYEPGPVAHFFGSRTDCKTAEAEWLARDVRTVMRDGAVHHVVFRFEAFGKAYFCAPPHIAIWCGGAPLVNQFGEAETDDGTRFEVQRGPDEEWSATFFPTETEHEQKRCTFRVIRSKGPALTSTEFSL